MTENKSTYVELVNTLFNGDGRLKKILLTEDISNEDRLNLLEAEKAYTIGLIYQLVDNKLNDEY